jgi:GT2 family glycosyltransferase
MEKNIKFVVATPKNQEDFKQTSTCLSLEKLNLLKVTNVVYENRKPLTFIYNSFINEINKDNYVVFLHDDILVEDVFLLEKLTAGFELYDIVGVAGTKQSDLSVPKCAWHLMSDPKHFVGEVTHTKDKMFWTNSYGPTPSRALLIDGLFIAVNVQRLLETNTRFDEDFSFHHYDISFCLKANANKLKTGVFPIRLVHFGLGDSMHSKEWEKSNELFKQKYKG